MRKILTIALVALMAASLFAGVKTSGYVQGAAHMSIHEDKALKDNTVPKDSDNKAQVNINDENKVWGTSITAQSDKFITKTWLDVMKVAKVDSDVAVKVTFMTWDRVAALSAYSNKADNQNIWRLRTEKQGENVNVDFAYGKYVKAQAGVQFYQEAIQKDMELAAVMSVLATPVDGVKVSAGYKWVDEKADNATDSGFTVAAEADVAKLADLDFSLGAGVAYTKYDGKAPYASNNKADDGDLAMQVFGEYEGISGYVEISMLDNSFLNIGASYAFSEKADAGAYIQFADYEDIKFDENVTVGVEGNYKFAKNISFYGNVEYVGTPNTGKYNIDAEARIKVTF